MNNQKPEVDANGVAIARTYEFPQPREKVPLARFCFDPKSGTVLGRDAASWGKILLFYAIFYTVLAALFAICMQGLFKTLEDNQPKWKLDRSLIGTNPGLGFRPVSEATEKGSIIQFSSRKQSEVLEWIDLIDDFLEPYTNRSKHATGGKTQNHCTANMPENSTKTCVFDMESFGDCSRPKGYGYNSSKPCIFLKLNKIIDWVPEIYDNEKDLPDDMPASLKQHISLLPKSERKYIWVSCDGRLEHDKEIVGEIKYFPEKQGFPSHFYPYKNVEGYLSPLVAVQLLTPKVHELINVECRAWAKNIIYDGSLRDRKGSVLFEVLID